MEQQRQQINVPLEIPATTEQQYLRDDGTNDSTSVHATRFFGHMSRSSQGCPSPNENNELKDRHKSLKEDQIGEEALGAIEQGMNDLIWKIAWYSTILMRSFSNINMILISYHLSLLV